MDIEKIREDFPQLRHNFIYFDSGATALKPIPVLQAVRDYYDKYSTNIGRGIYKTSHKATVAYEKSHHKVLEFFQGDGEVIFTKNCTEAINIVAHGIDWKPQDKIIATYLEHNSNLLPWFRLKKFGVVVELLKCDPEGNIDLNELKQRIDNHTRLVAITHASNVIGTILPVAEITEISHKKGAMVLIDGAQGAPHLEIKLNEIDCDFYAVSGHKMMGPTGTGILFFKKKYFDELNPLNLGGGTVSDVYTDSYKLVKNWERFEGGTPNIAGGIGLGAAVDYLNAIGMSEIRKHEIELTAYFMDQLRKIDGVRIHGKMEPEKRTGVVSFRIKDIPSHRIAIIADEVGNVAIRSGLHCAFLMTRDILKEEQGTARASFYIYNTKDEIDHFVEIIKKIAKDE